MHPNLVDSPSAICELLTQSRTIAVLGIKTGAQEAQPALELAAAGIQVVQDRCIMVDHRVLQ